MLVPVINWNQQMVDMQNAESETAAVNKRVAARARKQKEHIARLSAQGRTRRRRLANIVATTAPGSGGHGDRSSGEDAEDNTDVEIGALIPDPEVFADLHITPMTGWRWDRDPRMAALGWPLPIYRGRYKFRSAAQYQKFKDNLVRQAIAKRNALLGETVKEEGATA
jgi:hypothetical protein